MRLDAGIASVLEEYSRTKIKDWILAGHVKLDHEVVTDPAHLLTGYEFCEVEAQIQVVLTSVPENIPLDIVYEDEEILVINKPKDLVVHPGAGNPRGTLMNALLYHYPELNKIPRAGIVHRLDKDTTGLMVVAKTLGAQTSLVEQLQSKTVTREYEAVAYGLMTRGGTIREPIGRHPTKRTAMAVDHKNGKPAVTLFRVMETYRNYTRIRLRLETGRTHQIRVHMSHISHPLLGDITYGGQIRLPKNALPELVTCMREFKRQALHAVKLSLEHPTTGETMTWEVPLPEDMEQLISLLQQDRDQGSK
ncbi:23S rRNA pseudouridine(1911/1915/1917) synthase RluD [Psittacicella gerlachiana]|uniref:Pseudouridine synthase n=1 Tax=Psittacicella gerlachiana TaxID=2028574 RepID=A0A3A1YBR6_9GAMM|nr:23S rRNA pseudouridine(1911/1915/1917) synthase RluD [Psittacicella gerlachiana]RIY34816.1 23S rRNA pseudouridine(1911/1915/1917) synthase [Psittacicella gerlachiana]